MTALEVYAGSDGELTKRYYAELSARGPIGLVAMNLFRAQKASSRAKVYRGGIRGQGSFKRMAYDKKSWSMEQLVEILGKHGSELNITYGWKQDLRVLFGEEASWVLYVDLPTGQVSFHSPTRGSGPDYPGQWDGLRESAGRIVRFCDRVMGGVAA